MEEPLDSSGSVRQAKTLPPPLAKLPRRPGTAPSTTCLTPRSTSLKTRSPTSPSISISPTTSPSTSPTHTNLLHNSFDVSTSNPPMDEVAEEEEGDPERAYADYLHFSPDPQTVHEPTSLDGLHSSSPSSTAALYPISEYSLGPSSPATPNGHLPAPASPILSPTSPTFSISSKASSVLMRYKSTSPNPTGPSLSSSSMALSDLTETLDCLLENVSSTSLDLLSPTADISKTGTAGFTQPSKGSSPSIHDFQQERTCHSSSASFALTDVEPLHGPPLIPAPPSPHMQGQDHTSSLPLIHTDNPIGITTTTTTTSTTATTQSNSHHPQTTAPPSRDMYPLSDHLHPAPPPSMIKPSLSDEPSKENMPESTYPYPSIPDSLPSNPMGSRSKEGSQGGFSSGSRSLSKTLLSTFRSPSSAKKSQFRSFFSSSSSTSSSSPAPTVSILEATHSQPISGPHPSRQERGPHKEHDDTHTVSQPAMAQEELTGKSHHHSPEPVPPKSLMTQDPSPPYPGEDKEKVKNAQDEDEMEKDTQHFKDPNEKSRGEERRPLGDPAVHHAQEKENQGMEKQWIDQILLESSSFTRVSPQDFSLLVEEERVLTSRIGILAEAHVRESRIRDSASSLASLHHSNKKTKKKALAELLTAECKVSRVLVDLWRLEGKRADVRQKMGRARSAILRDGLQASEERCRKLEAAREIRRKSVVQSVHARESLSLSSHSPAPGDRDTTGATTLLAATGQMLALRARVEELEGVLLETNEELTRARQERKGAVELMEEERRRVTERDRELEEVGQVVRKIRSVGEDEWLVQEEEEKKEDKGDQKEKSDRERRISISPMVARLQGLQEDLERSEGQVKILKGQLSEQEQQHRDEVKRLRSALPHEGMEEDEEDSSQDSSLSGDIPSAGRLAHQGSKDSLSAGWSGPSHHRQGSHSTQYTAMTSQSTSTFRPGSSGSGRPGAPSALCRMLTQKESECRELRDKLVELRRDIRELELGQEEMIGPIEELWEELPLDPKEPMGPFTLPVFLSRVSRLIHHRTFPSLLPGHPSLSSWGGGEQTQDPAAVDAIFRAAQEVGEVFGKATDGAGKRMDQRELASIHASLSPTTSPPLSPTRQLTGLGHPLTEAPNTTSRGRTDISALLTKLERMQGA
ncbi:hypothetical protein BJ684DRAFT_18718 [Piptocephalis cylindrospora]|uniref:Up-regulated during septation protein 1 domain-containing protein n=1 Tax=Piptocephalis cylindrospora TaxID=1907219 RepID=A0A4P9Y726_9FUNG|nr:hypothetical protein BJ684DRAFT_18718 [Piptocephalis cylindrospora]|eukprot:RKP14907.1 hypothetical protein BJ684DRAFT_18718 [Piptocephalis cylindrospora]